MWESELIETLNIWRENRWASLPQKSPPIFIWAKQINCNFCQRRGDESESAKTSWKFFNCKIISTQNTKNTSDKVRCKYWVLSKLSVISNWIKFGSFWFSPWSNLLRGPSYDWIGNWKVSYLNIPYKLWILYQQKLS